MKIKFELMKESWAGWRSIRSGHFFLDPDMRPLLPAFTALAGALLTSVSAQAEDCAAPCAGYSLSAEVLDNWIFGADPSSMKSNTLKPTLTTELYVLPSENVKLFTSVVTEQVIEPEPGIGSAFKDIGTYVSEAYASFDLDPVSLRAGKFDPAFSLASEVSAGINEDELSSAIDVDGRWGAEAALAFDALGLQNAIVATAFTTDRTVLSDSLFTSRGQTRLSVGGAGNTSGISSYGVTLNGCNGSTAADCADEGDFGYRLGFRHQRAGNQTQDQLDEGISPSSEQAYLAGVFTKFDLNDDMSLRLAAEAAYVKHFEGDPDDTLLFTGSAMIEQGQVKYIAAYTQKNNIISGEANTREHLADLEVIYASGDDNPVDGADWELAAAYTFIHNEDNQDAHLLSLRAILNFAGSTAAEK
jgi:hypothetical protein